jgi:hypothetical protein
VASSNKPHHAPDQIGVLGDVSLNSGLRPGRQLGPPKLRQVGDELPIGTAKNHALIEFRPEAEQNGAKDAAKKCKAAGASVGAADAKALRVVAELKQIVDLRCSNVPKFRVRL